MKMLQLGVLIAGILTTALPAAAQRSNPGGSGNDPCMQEADRLYSYMRNLEERMRVKRAHIAKCRASSGKARR